jgi:hypothetical protein
MDLQTTYKYSFSVTVKQLDEFAVQWELFRRTTEGYPFMEL